jgi:predicted enzyme related to lactoylglutathione lyase
MQMKHFWVVGALAVLLSGCAGRTSLPAISSADASDRLVGKFVWRDLLTENSESAESFYGELFGWTFRETGESNYTLILHRGRPIGGMFSVGDDTPDINESQWVSLLSVSDIEDAVNQIRNDKGQVHVAPVDVSPRGTVAVVSDSQGALLAFVKTNGGDPPDRDAAFGDWLWTELWTYEVDRALAFYGQLADYTHETAGEKGDYTILEANGAPRAGILELSNKKIRPHWVPYVRVENAQAIADRVDALGGAVVMAPRDDIRNGTVAVIADPSGAVMAVQEWTPKG